ncbi:hypothetical protein [Rhizobium sp. Root483D2]|uniref:hypothetical protein n=1 Tax=Rhizobium sp. Root483D2 TaxID=1736545 RepID=UPI0007137899|nr:hypothetical protein [Rhizobium sp. Root483D2]KQY40761.1 hypothetical protein ASD32_04030 [Rhizobium sp. Root483D2]
MNTTIKTLGAAAIAVMVGLTSFMPASAAPVRANDVQLSSSVELAQYRQRDSDAPRWKKRHQNRHDRAERRKERRGYWNGHRGYREHRRGYRRHSDGYYYSPEVFRLYIR